VPARKDARPSSRDGKPSSDGRTAANLSAARSSWVRISCLAGVLSGVSGRSMSSRRIGTSGAYFPASLRIRGPVLWIRPTPLSVKSEALMTRAHGFRRRLSATCSRYCSLVSRSGAYCGLVTAETRSATRGLLILARGGLRAACAGGSREVSGSRETGGQLGGMIFDRVVQERGADHVGVADAVVRHDPDRHPEQVVDVRLPFSAVGGVQPGRQVQGLVQAALVLIGQRCDLRREPLPQALLAVGRGNSVQRHRGHQPPLVGVHALEVAHEPPHTPAPFPARRRFPPRRPGFPALHGVDRDPPSRAARSRPVPAAIERRGVGRSPGRDSWCWQHSLGRVCHRQPVA
jgi:hypothetical protein